MAEILPIRRKTLFNQLINQCEWGMSMNTNEKMLSDNADADPDAS